MTEEDYKLMAGMDPKALQQMLGLGTIDDQSQLLQQQMAMAEALRQPDQKNYGTAGGNIGAGIGNALGAFAGGMQQRELMGQQRGLIDQRQGGRDAYANALAEALKGRFGGGAQTPAKDTSWGAPESGGWDGMATMGGAPNPLMTAPLPGEVRPKQKPGLLSQWTKDLPSWFPR